MILINFVSMKAINKILPLLLAGLLFLSACKKDDEPLFEDPIVGVTDSVISKTMFTSQGSYKVSGELNVYLKDSVYVIEFKNFSSSSGPALEVWLSESISPKGQIVLGDLKSTSGNFSYTANLTAAQFAKYTHVLVWCERFSVGFGYAPILR